MFNEKANIRKTLNYLIRAAIIVVTYGFIYRQVFRKREPGEILDAFDTMMQHPQAWSMIILILAMMILNWGLESLKWQLLIRKIEHLGFFKAYKAVLTGVSVSLFTPNRTGDYLGRVFILDKGNHIEGIFITLVGSFAQIVITISIGLFSFLAFLDQYLRISYSVHDYLFTGLVFLIPTAVFLLLLVYFKIGLLYDFMSRIFPGKWEKLLSYTRVLARFSPGELLWNLLLSLARYIVFSLQFFLLLRVFGAEIPLVQGLVLIPVIYLALAIVPSMALTDLGIRGSVSLFILGLYFTSSTPGLSSPEIAILSATTLLWLVNIILPAILGTFFVFNLKFFRNKP